MSTARCFFLKLVDKHFVYFQSILFSGELIPPRPGLILQTPYRETIRFKMVGKFCAAAFIAEHHAICIECIKFGGCPEPGRKSHVNKGARSESRRQGIEATLVAAA